MWNAVVSPVIGLSLFTGGITTPAVQKAVSGPVTYWQENRCLDRDLGSGARLRWCVESLVVTVDGPLEVHVSWTGSGLAGNKLFKDSDANNHRMYLLDDLGKRYDSIDTRGAARRGGRLDSEHPVLRGVFVFPPPGKDTRSFTFRDDDQNASLQNLTLSPESRTDAATSSTILERVTQAETLRIDARLSGAKEASEQYFLRRTPNGFHLESDSRDPTHPDLVIPPPVMELFFQSLSESPLLERAYKPKPAVINDYPAITLDLRTEKEGVVFFSRPEGDRFAPWRAETGGKVYLVPDDSPLRSLEILDPFLERDPKSRAMKLLSPHLGEERANELWAKLEAALGSEEALGVTRRLEDLLSRDVDESEIWLAVDEYIAQASPSETSSKESPAGASPVSVPNSYDLLTAVQAGDADAVRALLSAGADPDVRGRDGRTALMLAAESGQTGNLHTLVGSGAKPNVQTLRGDTALMLAARNRHGEAVRILLQAGASPKLADSHGSTALMETTDADIARTLIRGGADVNAVDDRGLTPIMRLIGANRSAASPEERAQILQSLLTAGADVKARDREGRTALIWAIKGTPSTPSYPGLARLLIAAGSEVDARDREGGTPLIYAAVRGDERSVRLLIDAGADVNAHMGNLSALDIALRYGHPEIVALLIRVGARR